MGLPRPQSWRYQRHTLLQEVVKKPSSEQRGCIVALNGEICVEWSVPLSSTYHILSTVSWVKAHSTHQNWQPWLSPRLVAISMKPFYCCGRIVPPSPGLPMPSLSPTITTPPSSAVSLPLSKTSQVARCWGQRCTTVIAFCTWRSWTTPARKESAEAPKAAENPAPTNYPPVAEWLRLNSLLDPLPDRQPVNPADLPDVTREPIAFPAPRAHRLQSLSRADTGGILALGYASMRGDGLLIPP